MAVHDTTGVLVGIRGPIVGSARRNTPRFSSGALTGQGSTVAGAAKRFTAKGQPFLNMFTNGVRPSVTSEVNGVVTYGTTVPLIVPITPDEQSIQPTLGNSAYALNGFGYGLSG